MSIAKQIGLFAISILLPPLGLWPGIKLLMRSDRKAQAVGLIAIFLTALSVIISGWLLMGFINNLLKSSQIQMSQYQN